MVSLSEEIRLNEPGALGVARAVMAVALAVTGWWAAREQPDGDRSGPPGRRLAHRRRDE